MIKSRYFCDRCRAETTTIGAQFALYEVVIARPASNALKMAVCKDCARIIAACASPAPAPETPTEK